MKKAWVENDTIRDICVGAPDEYYHPSVAVHYTTDVPDDIVNGATLVDGVWTNPAVVDLSQGEATEEIHVSPVEFKLLWTSAERIAAKALQETDPVIADFFDILDDSRLTIVNLSLASTQDGVGYLLSKLVEVGVVAEEDVPARLAAILSGQFV